MTKILFALFASLALFAGTAIADPYYDASVSLQSKLLNHGKVVSEDPSVGLALRFKDVVVPGVYFRTNFDSVSLTPLNGNVSFRSDLGVGYANDITKSNFLWDVSVNRVFNPVIYPDDYTVLRGSVSHGLLFVRAEQGLTANVNKNTYLALGVQKTFGVYKLGGLVSTTRYNTPNVLTRDEFNFTNAELFATANVYSNLDLNVNYSYGGRDRFGNDVKNQLWGGLTYRF
jgi:hypothetical protein